MRLPVDPFSPNNKLLRYRRVGDSYLSWSVGPNGVDDDGREPEELKQGSDFTFSTGDLRLDLLFYDPPPEDSPDLSLEEQILLDEFDQEMEESVQ